MKTERKKTVKSIFIIAAVVAVLAVLGITASATGFFGLSSVTLSDGEDGLISMQGYADSDEYKALWDYYYGGLTLEEAASKYGLTVPERTEVYEYDQMSELLGGELTDERNTRWSFVIYEDGTFSGDQDFTCSDGTLIAYQMYRGVKGSLTQVTLNTMSMGDDYEEWNVKLAGHDICLVLGSADRSLIIADLGESFFTANVLAGKRADSTFGGPITREQLEELAKSMNWDVLSRVVVPELPPAQPEVQYGAGVELEPQYIDAGQSFEVELPYYGKTNFITYLPTPEFDDVRFFLSKDGKVSDYEFHAMYNGKFHKVAAVSFEDLDGNGATDVLALVDYKPDGGGFYRDIRVFQYQGDGEFEPVWELRLWIEGDTEDDLPTVADVRKMCEEHFADGGEDPASADVVVASCTIEEGGARYYLEAFGQEEQEYNRWGISEIRVYPYVDYGKPLAEPVQVIRVEDAGEDYVRGIYDGYTECPDKEGVMTVLDMNFDGYADIGVFGWTPNNTIPYYYWFWDPVMERFEYAITLQGAEVDAEKKQVMETYKSGGGSEYTCNYYEPDENGMLRLVDTQVEKFIDYVEANDYEGMLAFLQSQYTDPFWLHYGLFDLTGDGTPELIATYGTCEADAEAGVWSFDTGRLKMIGAFDMGHSLLYVKDGELIRLAGHMGYEIIDVIGFDGSGITQTNLSQRELGPEDSYAEPGERLPMSEDSDLELLRQAGLIGMFSPDAQ